MTLPDTAGIERALARGRSFKGTRKHVLDLDDFSREEIDLVLNTAEAMQEVMGRDIKKVPTLRGKSLVTLFYEPSTRTRVSFEQAAKVLSADVINLTPSISSAVKGESLLNTTRTLKSMGVDVLVVRHPQSGAPYLMARDLGEVVSVINAGDGSHAHPTQGLLDLYTIRAHLGTLQGIRVAVVGDILYSRVARSNLWGLTAMGAEVVLCGPPPLIPTALIEALQKREEHPIARLRVETRLESTLEGADVVMVLRLQLERQQAGLLSSPREYARLYQVNSQTLRWAKPGALVLHPGPMNEGLEISPEVAHGAQSVIEEQVANGVAVRMALLYLLTSSGKQVE